MSDLNVLPKLRIWSALITIGCKSFLMYKNAILINLLSSFIFLTFQITLFGAIVSNGTKVEVNFQQLIIYFCIVQLIRIIFPFNVSANVAQTVKSGEIVYALLKPFSYTKTIFLETIGTRLSRLFFLGIPFFLILVFLIQKHLHWDVSWILLPYLLFLFVCCYIFVFLFEFILGSLSFYVANIWGIDSLKEAILIAVSGQMLPLAFYPPFFQRVISYSPFRMMYDIPAKIILAPYDLVNVETIIYVCAWVIIFYIIYKILFQKLLSYLTIQGG